MYVKGAYIIQQISTNMGTVPAQATHAHKAAVTQI